MNIKIVGRISARSLLKECGADDVQPILVSECAREMDRYVPMQTGITKNTRVVEPDGVTYLGPHTQYIYHGMLMAAPSGSAWAKKGERKHLTDKPLSYHGEPTRGPYWDKRMWADKGRKICARLSQKCGGKAL